MRNGFTLIELLVVVAIIGVLASVILASLSNAREDAYEARAKTEMKSMHQAFFLYENQHGSYPPDADRGLPPGLEEHLSSGGWPDAPWPGSVYDYDHWTADQLSSPPYEPVYQVSIRYCDIGDASSCNFPDQDWVSDNWDTQSSFFYCLSGPCRAHSNVDKNHPGYCVGGRCPSYCQGECEDE